MNNQLLSTMPRNEKCILFSCPEMQSVADQMLQGFSDHVEKGNVSWEVFPDGYPNLFIDDVHNIRSRDVIFLASFLNPISIFTQLSVIMSLPRYLARSVVVVLPYFPTGTMERVEEEGQIATAATLARVLSCIPLSSKGPNKLVIFDIHALQERFYFSDNVIPILATAIPLLLKRIESHHAEEKIAVAFPDEGAWKRFGKKFDHFPLLICTKVRENEKRIVKLKEGNPIGYHVFIVDDLVQTGGTLLECKAALLSAGAFKVSAFVTHAIFPKQSWKKFTSDENPFTAFYITDSCASTAEVVRDIAPFHVLPIASSIVDVILSIV